MIQDVRKGVRSSFLYKRFAYYQSEGFTPLINFLQDENLLDKFWEEFNFTSNSMIERELKFFKKPIPIEDFIGTPSYSFTFSKSKYGRDFWRIKTFCNHNFKKIKEKLL